MNRCEIFTSNSTSASLFLNFHYQSFRLEFLHVMSNGLINFAEKIGLKWLGLG